MYTYKGISFLHLRLISFSMSDVSLRSIRRFDVNQRKKKKKKKTLYLSIIVVETIQGRTKFISNDIMRTDA